METMVSSVMNNLIVPLIAVIAGILITMVQRYLEKFSNGIEVKNSLFNLEKQLNIRNKLVEILSEDVKSTVASNMTKANEFKKAGNGKLTQEQQEELRNQVKAITINSISSIISSNEGLLEMIGGKESLDSLIDILIEKYVYEYKISQASTSEDPTMKIEK